MYRTSFCFFFSSYKTYHVKKNLGVPFKRPTSLHLIRFVKEPRCGVCQRRNSRKKNSKHTPLQENARVVQQYRCLKPNIGFWKWHTFDRTSCIKDNSSVVADWLIFVFYEGWGSVPWVLGTPDLWGDAVESHRETARSRAGEPSRLDRPTYKHVGKAFKTELPRQTKDWKNIFNVQRGQHNAREEHTVETHQAFLPCWYENWASGLICNPTFIPNNNNETMGNIKNNEAV